MKKISKILLMLAIMIIAFIAIPNTEVNAENVEVIEGVKINPEAPANGSVKGMSTVIENILGFLQAVSAILTLVMIAVTGFRYIMDTPEVKTELKRSMVPIIVGLALVFSATSIAKFLIGIFEN